ncbi:hypothetical protein AL532_13970 [Pseudomonas monteilii]|uniref:Uncharacterized protein n=1 Tax=Pseudomonas monteilii TaxID=76759 RepID=A0A6G6V3D3_9PSED|nr:hypothetical protein AL532_13970 [Pseudomonas monteilii]MVF51653.1 hypothetical protein [Pseudomonas monteilii]QIG20154.1 hypothetical protein FY041_21630 [Pseudomonas monteilii]QIG25406.1 hypothetical protein FY043_21625 [Pseudomonas monteilii]
MRLLVYKLQVASFKLQDSAASRSACFFLRLEAWCLKLDWTGILHAFVQYSGGRRPCPDIGCSPG